MTIFFLAICLKCLCFLYFIFLPLFSFILWNPYTHRLVGIFHQFWQVLFSFPEILPHVTFLDGIPVMYTLNFIVLSSMYITLFSLFPIISICHCLAVLVVHFHNYFLLKYHCFHTYIWLLNSSLLKFIYLLLLSY